ncbi:hypothetical protein ACROYT_G017688 [Oculina patagonica]
MCTCANFKMPPPFLENAQGKLCLHDDSLYKPWERFVNQRCTGYCTCNGRSGSVACVSLCPPSPIPMCAQGQVPEIRNEPTAVDPTGRCKCKRQSCRPRPNFPPLPPPVTRPECRNRAPDEWFLNKSCTGRLRRGNLTNSQWMTKDDAFARQRDVWKRLESDCKMKQLKHRSVCELC